MLQTRDLPPAIQSRDMRKAAWKKKWEAHAQKPVQRRADHWDSQTDRGGTTHRGRVPRGGDQAEFRWAYYRWKTQYGGLEVSQLCRLRQLEDENQKPKAAQKQQHPQFPQFEIALATVWRQVILSAGIAVLGFVSFILTLLWDQQQLLWLAAIALLVGFVAAPYVLWLSISLQRFYATTANANTNTNTNYQCH